MSEGGGQEHDLLDFNELAFDPSGTNLPPPLRPPALSQAQLLAAIELGFSDKFLPSDPATIASGPGPGNVRNGNSRLSYQEEAPDFGATFNPDDTGFGGSNSNQFSGDCVDSGNNIRRGVSQEEEGLLDPLRRPHINEIPPDVLAVLLKTTRFEEILGPMQNQQQGPNSGPSGQISTQPRMPLRNNQQQHPRHQVPPQPQQSQSQSRSPGPGPQNPGQRQQQSPQQWRQPSNISNPNSPNLPTGKSQDVRQQSSNSNSNGSSSSSAQPSSYYAKTKGVTTSSRIALSPMAKEFYPRSAPPQTAETMNYQEQADLAEALAQFQFQQQNEGQEFIDFSQGAYAAQSFPEDNSDCILSTVTDVITDLTNHPANFNRCVKSITDVLTSYLVDVDTLGVVVTLLVEQSISNPNFCYSGARLSQALTKCGVAVGNVTFKALLLTRCQEEFKTCEGNTEDPEIQFRTRGLLMFFGELFMNIRMESTPGNFTPFFVLGYGALDLMQKLVKDPSHENIKAVFQVLKLIGWELENASDKKCKEHFEELMKSLSYVCLTGTVKPQTKNLLDALFELKNKKWNREELDTSANSCPSPASTFSSTPSNGNNFYELPESDEENFGEDDCILLDDEPEEVQRAFDEFLKTANK